VLAGIIAVADALNAAAIAALRRGHVGVIMLTGDNEHTARAIAGQLGIDNVIAIGLGSDVAEDTGGIILIRNDVRDVVTAIRLSRAAMSQIKQNLFWAFI
jgi:Cu+-exporting ATPase